MFGLGSLLTLSKPKLIWERKSKKTYPNNQRKEQMANKNLGKRKKERKKKEKKTDQKAVKKLSLWYQPRTVRNPMRARCGSYRENLKILEAIWQRRRNNLDFTTEYAVGANLDFKRASFIHKTIDYTNDDWSRTKLTRL